MPKTELRVSKHAITEGAFVYELWHEGQLVGEVVGLENEAGVKVVSKYALRSTYFPMFPNLMQIDIDRRVIKLP